MEGRRETEEYLGSETRRWDVGGKQEEISSCPRGTKLNSDVRTTIGRGKLKVTQTMKRKIS